MSWAWCSVCELLFLDLDNTLIDRRASFSRWAARYASEHPEIVTDSGPEAAVEALLAADAAGAVARDHFCATVAGLFPAGRRPAVDDVWREFAAAYIEAVEPEPDVLTALDRLARRYRLALVSNGSGERQRAKLKRGRLEGYFEQIFISNEVGATKPEPQIFRRALAACRLRDPGLALMVGDDPARDIAGAAGVALPCCWIARGRRWDEQGQSVEPTLIVEDVPALALKLLGAEDADEDLAEAGAAG